jgi:hypothetical protein
MLAMSNLTEAVISEIKRDIASFSDPGTPVEIGAGGIINWERDRDIHEATLVTTSSFPDVIYKDHKLSYQSFLASEGMADLQYLAASILTQVPPIDDYIAAPAQELSHTENPKKHDKAEVLLLDRVQASSLPFGSTRVVFLHGNAGMGKSSLLRHITRVQADRYLKGETPTLLLYLDAQGKGLSQLEDVMARALQDLRAHFTYHSLASLTRTNCVVPIVDGFDELIGPTSAREAFSNLAQFLLQLDRKGAIITSSRSAFIDYQTLHERATEIAFSQGLSYEIYPIELTAWSDSNIFDLAQRILGNSKEKISILEKLMNSSAGELVKKPFFLTHICKIIAEGGEVKEDSDLVSQVVNAGLQREMTKLQDKRQKPLLTVDEHRHLCQAFADEMWLQERSDLDIQTIKVIAELFADECGLALENKKLLLDRSIAHGFLKNVHGDSNRREFEHELFRYEFQAGKFSEALLGEEIDAKNYIMRREISPDLTERVAAYRPYSDIEIINIVNRLSEFAHRSRSNMYASSNGGMLASALFRVKKTLPKGGRLFSLHIRNESLCRISLNEWNISDCTLELVDLDGAAFLNCVLNSDVFITCKLTSSTSFRDSKLTTKMFVGIMDEKGREYYDPGVIAETLRRAGAELPPDIPIEAKQKDPTIIKRTDLAERFLQHARTHFNISLDDDWVQTRIKNDKDTWEYLVRLLREHNLIMDAIAQKSGPAVPIWRLTVSPDVIWRGRATMNPSRPEINAFWRDLEMAH